MRWVGTPVIIATTSATFSSSTSCGLVSRFFSHSALAWSRASRVFYHSVAQGGRFLIILGFGGKLLLGKLVNFLLGFSISSGTTMFVICTRLPASSKGVKCLVREIAVAHIALGETDAGLDGLVGISHIMMFLVFLLNIAQDFEGLFRSGRLHHNLLETALGVRRLSRCSGGIRRGLWRRCTGSRPLRGAGFSILAASMVPGALPAPTMVCISSIKSMMSRFLVSSSSTALMRSSNWPPVFGACHHSRHVESDHAFVEKHAADLALVYPEREAFDNG